MKSIILSLLLGLTYYVDCLKPEEYCYINEICEQTEDGQRVKKSCQKAKCHGELSYKCGHELCARNRLNCQQIHMWSILIGQMKDNFKIEFHMRNFEIFSTRIENCALYEWKPSDVCINQTKCAYKPQIWSLSFMKVVLGECPCKVEYPYKCGNGFCAIDKHGCEGLIYKKIDRSINSGSLKEIKKCH